MIAESRFTHRLELFITGLFALPLIVIYLLLTIPILIYRIVIVHLIAPSFRPDIGNIISGLDLSLALEFYQRKKLPLSTSTSSFQFKNIIVARFFAEGIIPLNELLETFELRVLNKLNAAGDQLFYPELQQYPSTWMGFMFWKEEKDFNLKDHFYCHKTEEMEKSEAYADKIMEELVNKRFPLNKSPWEMHIIYNHKNGIKKTILLFCVHHSIADGTSLAHLLTKDYFITPNSNLSLTSPSKLASESRPSGQNRSRSIWEVIMSGFGFPIQILSDLGYVLQISRFLRRTPWHVKPDEKWKKTVIISQSKQIPMRIVKDVKNRFGVTFTSVMLSIFAKGISESFQMTRSTTDPFTLLVVQPLPNHPKELRNHATAIYLDIFPSQALSPVERLRLIDSCFREQQKLVMRPLIASILLNLFSFQPAFIANLLIGRNPTFPILFSNFCIPMENIAFNGRKILDMDFTLGTLQGVAGVVFIITSYQGEVRLGATVGSGVMGREELDELLGVLRSELYDLYHLAH